MQATLSVPSITCDHCAQTISRSLEPLNGIQSVDVDIAAREVTLRYHQRAHLDAALRALESTGYPVAASAPGEDPPAEPRRGTVVDPVCGMTVRVEDASFSSNRDGGDHFFCSSGCKSAFEAGQPPGLEVESTEPATACGCCSST